MSSNHHLPPPGSTLSLESLAAMPKHELHELLSRDARHTAAWLHQAACFGLVEAQTALGQMLLDGRGTPADAAAARGWFASAAAKHHPPAANMLGRCLERGWGGPVDMEQAGQHYRAAAEAGLDWGQYNLANMLLRGRGMTRDAREAFDWFSAASRQGHAKSMNLVGRFHEEGWIAPPDLTAAAAWYRCAAMGGDFRGQHNLATLLAQGGFVADAELWFTLAAETGSLDFRRVAADQLLGHPDPALRRIGLQIAARNCKDGDGEDFLRHGKALAHGADAPKRLARAWLLKAVAAGCQGAQAELDKIETPPVPRAMSRISRLARQRLARWVERRAVGVPSQRG